MGVWRGYRPTHSAAITSSLSVLLGQREGHGLLVFAYHDTMGGPGSESGDHLTLHGGEGDNGLVCAKQ